MHTPAPPAQGDFDFSDLSVTQRIDLAHALRDSVRDEVERRRRTETEAAEIRWRLDAINAGLMVCEPFEQVMTMAARR